ncbi:MAG: Uxx-star family glutaredoxin-like (seleno)protein [Patescibacteria group bacterium]
MKVIIYTTISCPYCHQAKEYFQAQKIDFEEIDVGQNPQAAQEMVKLSGQMGVPVIVIDNKVMVGFDQKEIESALGKKP